MSTTTSEQAPLVQLLQAAAFVLKHVGSGILLGLKGLWNVVDHISYPLLLPIPILLYLLAPFIVFLQVVVDVLILTPINITLSLARAFYPLYVFIGVACITGVLLGYCGRTLTQLVVAFTAPPPSRTTPEPSALPEKAYEAEFS